MATDLKKKLAIALIAEPDYMVHGVARLRDAIRRAGHDAVDIRPADLSFDVEDDQVFASFGGSRLPIDGAILASVVFNDKTPLILDALRAAKVPCVNPPEAVQISMDKFSTHLRLRRAGIKMPRTSLTKGHEQAVKTAEHYGYPVVFKALDGSGGHQVARAYDANEARKKLNEISDPDELILVQEHLELGGKTKRILVINGEVIPGMQLTAPEGDFKTNMAGGGMASATDVTPEEARVALAAAEASGLNFVGVDIATVMEDSIRPGGPKKGDVVLLEINSLPGIFGPEEISGHDVSGRVVASLVEKILFGQLRGDLLAGVKQLQNRPLELTP